MTSNWKRAIVGIIAFSVILLAVSLNPLGGIDPVIALLVCGVVCGLRPWFSEDDEENTSDTK